MLQKGIVKRWMAQRRIVNRGIKRMAQEEIVKRGMMKVGMQKK